MSGDATSGTLLPDQLPSHGADEDTLSVERRHRAILDHTFEFIGLLAPDGTLLEANRAALNFLNLKESDVLGKPFWDTPWWAHSREMRDRLHDAIKTAATGEFVRIEATHPTSYGTIHYIDFSLSPVRDNHGNVVFLVPEGRDITDRKRAEDNLREFQHRFRDLIDNAHDGIIFVDTEAMTIVFGNQAMANLLGRSVAELSGLPLLEMHPLDSHDRVVAEFLEHHSGQRRLSSNMPVVRNDGARMYADITSSTVMLNGVRYLSGFFRDVTERKQAQDALRESERKLKEAQSMARLGYWHWDVTTGDVEWSDEVFRIFDLDPTTFTPHINAIQALSPWPEDHYRDKELIQIATTNRGQGEYDQRFLLPDGSTGHYHSTFQGKYDDLGNLVAIVGTVMDVTDRKRTEIALRESEARLNAVLQGSPIPQFVIDNEHRITHWNPALEKYSGIKAEDVIGTNQHWRAFYDSQRPCMADLLVDGAVDNVTEWYAAKGAKSSLLLENAYEVTDFFPHVGSSGAWLHFTAALIRDADGRVTGAVETLEDVTGRKRAEAERERLFSQQAGISLLQRSLLQPAPLETKLRNVADGVVRLFDADFCRIWLLGPGDRCDAGCMHAAATEDPHVCRNRRQCLHLQVSSGRYTHIDGPEHCRVPLGCYKIGRIACGTIPSFITNDVQNDPRVHNRQWARELGLIAFAGYQLRSPDGQPLGVLALFSKHPLSNGENSLIDGLASAVELVVEQSRAEETVRLANQHTELANAELARAAVRAKKLAVRAEAANRAKTEFLANMSHELRTPLVAIVGFSEAMLEHADVHPLNEYQKDRLQQIKTNGERLHQLVNGVLDVAKAESGHVDLHITSFDIEPLAWDVADLAESLVKDKPDVRFILDMEGHLSPITSDRDKLRQILVNLVGNAAKFTERGTVTLRIHGRDDSLVFSVEDTGVGIAPDDVGRIFDKFFQAKQATHRSLRGAGLGLPISKAFAVMLGGTLTVESVVGQGSTFRLTIPRVLDPRANADFHEVAEADASIATSPAQQMPSILCIESDPTNAASISRYVTEAGHRVISADSGIRGCRLASLEHPRAVVLDVTLPTHDAWNILHRLKDDPTTSDIRVILAAGPDAQNLRLLLGPGDYVAKPVAKWQLVRAIRRVSSDSGRDVQSVAVVDDDPGTLQAVAQILAEEHGQAWTFDSSESFLASLATRQPDAVMVGLTTQGEDAFHVIEALRARPDGGDVPVIVMTPASVSDEDRERLNERLRALVEANAGDREANLREFIDQLCLMEARNEQYANGSAR